MKKLTIQFALVFFCLAFWGSTSLKGQNSSGMPAGNIGIGITTPTCSLQIHKSSSPSFMQITNASTGTTSADGFTLGISSLEAQIINRENGALSIWTNNQSRLTIDPSGKVGIGTATPFTSMLTVGGSIANTGDFFISLGHIIGRRSSGPLKIISNTDQLTGSTILLNGGATTGNLIFTSAVPANATSAVEFQLANVAGNVRTMFITGEGNVGIGDAALTPGYKLDVQGTVRACEVRVNRNLWCDYVFESDYDLRSIDELQAYIEQYKHLPNIPAASVVEGEGLELGDMQKRMMEKIEELTLYVVELNQKVKDLEAQKLELLKADAHK